MPSSFSELIKLQRNRDKYSLLKNDVTTNTDREDFVYTKVSFDDFHLEFVYIFVNESFIHHFIINRRKRSRSLDFHLMKFSVFLKWSQLFLS